MRLIRRIFSPLIALIGIQLAWVLVVVFWITWFIASHRKLRDIAEKYALQLPRTGVDWFILVEGLVLLLAILAGVYVIFLYWNRQAALYRAQRNFVSQVTHELKSPLASLRLHLETVRLRKPPPEKLDGFVDTMLADADRLHVLINNLLSASRFDQRGVRLSLRRCDLSETVSTYFLKHRSMLPEGGTLHVDVEPGLMGRIEVESMEIVFRNLLENAILYSEGPPEISVRLEAQGKWAHLRVMDRGRGIDRKDQKRVFRMFYRVRHTGHTIRGSGLGLFIVAAIVRLHRGRSWVESEGRGQGSTFHIQLPLAPRKELS